VTDYLEVIGQNLPLRIPGLPFIAVPTTAGTGTEVTRNAVLGVTDLHVKVSLRSPFLLARIAIIDPELTLTLPPAITATTGLDALTQLIEPFTSNSPNPLTDALCEEGIRRVARSLRRAFDDGNNLAAREDLSMAALLSGMALANAKLGAVHGFAAPIGGEIPAQHGAICASLLPAVMSTNLSALSQRLPLHPALERYSIIARLLTGKPAASPEAGIQWIREFNMHTGIQPLAKLGLAPAAFSGIIEKAQKSSSMKGNPILLSEAELRMILEASL
jgi:alcohol dehydrogenase class IV